MPFREIIGHGTVVTLVSRAVARGSLPPSLLLTGPDGVGKRLVAQAVAEAINCEAPSAEGLATDACGACGPCRRIARGTYPDVIWLEPTDQGSLTVDQVRKVLDQAGYRPFEARRRVVMVDQADLLVPQAQNALLKTLEEPPASTRFVLVTARPDMLLDTVRSRCPQLRVGPLAVDEIVTILTDRHQIGEDVARPAAAAAGGSAGRALRAASGEAAASRGAALSLLDAVSAPPDAGGRLGGAKAFASGPGRRAPGVDRQELRRRLHALASLLRDLEVLGAGASVMLANADLAQPLRPLARAYGGGRGRRAFSVVDQALAAVDRNASPKVVADWVACRL